MENLLHGQLEKTSGNYRFTLERIYSDGSLPLLGTAFINGIRRDAADVLDKHCAKICAGKAVPSGRTDNFQSLSAGSSDLTHPRRKGELMRSRYCILNELGLCRKYNRQGAEYTKDGLYLRNNSRLLKLDFDCAACEMAVLE